jgi:hypothetical protein
MLIAEYRIRFNTSASTEDETAFYIDAINVIVEHEPLEKTGSDASSMLDFMQKVSDMHLGPYDYYMSFALSALT